MNIFRKLSYGFVICILIIFPMFLSSCFTADTIVESGADTGEDTGAEITRVEESGNGNITEEEFEALIGNEEFLETFNTFYYPDSKVKDARSVESDQDMIYVILEADEEFDKVENYYRDKKVQSIWSRDFIYRKSIAKVEEDFLETEEDALLSKFTFSSKDRDRVVDILLKDLDAGRTQIMITCWNLQ
ncbi:MAG: hypothetical protein MUO59_07920 [Actinobacteria bacterium]|nr:hypothetical protein [Actinomycetota bacterium]